MPNTAKTNKIREILRKQKLFSYKGGRVQHSESSKVRSEILERCLKLKPSKWNLTKKERLLWILPAAAIALLLVVSINIKNYLTDYTLTQPGYQYYGGGEFYFREGTVFRYNNEQTSVVTDETRSNMPTMPLYMEDESLFFPCDMIYWDVDQPFQSRIQYYTSVTTDKYDQIQFERDGSEKTVTGGFLFDGKDLYVFLEPVTLKFNSYKIELEPFSYVEVSATGDLMLYDHHWGEFLMETPRTSVVVSSESTDFTISLVGDTVSLYDGSSRMLASRPTAVDCLFE